MHGELENGLCLSLLSLSLSLPLLLLSLLLHLLLPPPLLSGRSSGGMNDYEPVREQGDKRPSGEIIGKFAS